MYTSHHPCWDAKNRYGLPEETPFEYEIIQSIIEERIGKEVSEPKTAPPKKEEPKKEPSREPEQEKSISEPETPFPAQDARIPKALRDLMEHNRVDEWEIQNVVEAKGYVPAGTPIWEYDTVNPGIVEGLLVASWDQVYAAVRQLREEQEIPFE